jgi:hypothetical protein
VRSLDIVIVARWQPSRSSASEVLHKFRSLPRVFSSKRSIVLEAASAAEISAATPGKPGKVQSLFCETDPYAERESMLL